MRLLFLIALFDWAVRTEAALCPDPFNVEPISKFCQDFTKVCVDQGDYVLYENKHNPRHTAFQAIPQINLDSVHVDYYGFGDVWGTEFLYPHPLLRPATSGEETKELQEPQFSRWCVRNHRCCMHPCKSRTAAPRMQVWLWQRS